MTLKQTLENNILYVVAITAIPAFVAGWGACQATIVGNKSEAIIQLERRVSELTQLSKEAGERVQVFHKENARLLAQNEKLEGKLSQSQENLIQWQASHANWQNAYKEAQTRLESYAANCSIFKKIEALQVRKDEMEYSVALATNVNTSEHRKLEDYRRIASEYHGRIGHLQEKLSCERKD